MRARLLLVLVVFALAAVAGFAVPLLSSTAEQRTQRLVIDRTADVERFVVLTQQAVDSGDHGVLAAEAEAYTTLYDEPVVVVDAHRTPLAQTGGLSMADGQVRSLVEATLRNQSAPPPPTVTPWATEPAFFTRPVGPGTRVTGVVVLRASVTNAAADVTGYWLTIGAGAVAAALVFVLVALLLARWVLRPLRRLEDGVLAVTAGQRAEVPARGGPAELRTLAAEFNQMSDAVVSAAEQQRRLVADASHQLRNPMAALRLRVDSLAPRVDDEGQRAYRATVTEVERLEALLDGLLALGMAESTATRLAAGGAAGEPAEVRSAIADRVDAWTAAAERAGVTLVAEDGPPLLVRCPEPDLAQVLDVLLDNAISYAGDGATVTVESTADGSIVVRDDGPGLSDEDRARATERFWRAGGDGAGRGTGLGLAIADRLVAGHGGRLELHAVRPHGLAVHVTLPGGEPS
ncbi:sensor histidine kinase [Amycolatopsis suaedae]|uniref:histidine kinase n=1 Tax=Amycolatopsis suaedae TaxID=2510978 RepID=A0A4Q7J7Q8_9PSEU|nr:HAMP domain-containing sensor histidine kinase [Amycolatopsis suaedae]RZQ63711.1 HAMP domain-containing histidine kinase [Amycolatopsis suaedae]